VIARLALTALAAAVVFLAGGALLPRTVAVERSIVIERPPATVFGLVNGFATLADWSPWLERDPDMRFSISEPAWGAGAWFEWRGDPRQVGAGRQQVVSSEPYRHVGIRFEQDQLGVAEIRFDIERLAGGSRLTWRYESDLVQGQGLIGGILSRYFGLFYEHWVGRDLERGLARLARFAVSLPAADYSGLVIERVEAAAADIAFLPVTGDGAPDAKDLAAAYRDLLAWMAAQGIERAGQPLAITRGGNGRLRIDAAFPIVYPADPEGAPAPPVRIGRSPGGAALRVTWRGGYDELAGVYGKLAVWMAVHGLRGGEVTWEQYLSDPALTPPEERVTHIYVLLED
jgi:effector-binding domain-containing protein